VPVKPCIGRSAKFMVITDAPTKGEEEQGQMAWGNSFGYIADALADAGLSRADGYWTALLKRPKEGKQVSSKEITTYAPYLQREIEAIKPPIIVLLGSQTVRHFIPDFKGKVSEVAGKIVYSKELDANVIIGFNPGEIYHAPEKQALLTEVFDRVAELAA
jgi:DNA polymerase-3 subunit alpha